MKKRDSLFTVVCVVFFFIFTVFMIWYIPSYSSVRSKIIETRQDLETSRGREAKQQAEYDSAVEELPLVKAELEEKEHLAEDAEAALTALKARRKELRLEKKTLEEAASGQAVQETENPEENTSGEEAQSDE